MRRVAGVALALVFIDVGRSVGCAGREAHRAADRQSSSRQQIGRLANPHNDIALLEKTLKVLSFEMVTVRDAGLAALHQAVNAYAA